MATPYAAAPHSEARRTRDHCGTATSRFFVTKANPIPSPRNPKHASRIVLKHLHKPLRILLRERHLRRDDLPRRCCRVILGDDEILRPALTQAAEPGGAIGVLAQLADDFGHELFAAHAA